MLWLWFLDCCWEAPYTQAQDRPSQCHPTLANMRVCVCVCEFRDRELPVKLCSWCAALSAPLSRVGWTSRQFGSAEKWHFQLGSIGPLPLDLRWQPWRGVISGWGNNWLSGGRVGPGSGDRRRLWNTRGQWKSTKPFQVCVNLSVSSYIYRSTDAAWITVDRSVGKRWIMLKQAPTASHPAIKQHI